MNVNLDGCCHFQADKKLVEKLPLLVSAWALAYPQVDIQDEIRRAHAWYVSRGKRYVDFSRMLHTWMKRSNDDAERDRRFNSERRQAIEQNHQNREVAKKEEESWEPDMTIEDLIEIRKRNLGPAPRDFK